MEGRYSPGILIQLADCTDPAQENEFNQWYNEDFIPKCEVLGFIRNTKRYENFSGKEPTFRGRPKYLTLAEVYRTDLKQGLKEYHDFDAKLKAGGQGFEAMAIKLDTIYEQFGPELRSERTGRPVKVLYCGLLGCTDLTREDEFNKWYAARHGPETLEAWADTQYRYKAVDLNDPLPHQTTPYVTLYETGMEYSRLQDALAAFRQQSASDPLWVKLLAVYFTGLFRPIYP